MNMIHKILVPNAISFTWYKELSLVVAPRAFHWSLWRGDLEMANTLPSSNMLMGYLPQRCCDVVAFLPGWRWWINAVMRGDFAWHSEQRSRFLLPQRLESSWDQGSGSPKMVLILSNVVNVKIKDILWYHLITHLKVYRQLVSIFKNVLEHNKSHNEVPFQNRRVERFGLAITFLA